MIPINDNTQFAKMDSSSVVRWGWYSVAVTLVLVVLNLIIARASNSLAVEAEAFHNFADFLTSMAILIGLRYSTRKSTKFPYGLYKLENFLSVGVALIIFFTAYEFVHDALFEPARETIVQTWMLIGLVIVTAIPLIFSHYQLRAGQMANSPGLIAAAKEFRTHVFTTGIVFISLLSTQINFPIDRIGVVIIAAVIIKTGWELLTDGMRALLDASLKIEVLNQIQTLIISEPAVTAIQWLNGRNAGRVRYIEAGVILRVREPEKIAIVTNRLEAKIRESVPYVERVLIHVETVPRTHLRYAIPLQNVSGNISEHFSLAPFFALITLSLDDGSITNQILIENPFLTEEKSRGIKVAEWLIEEKIDVLLVINSRQGKGPGYVLSEAGIEEKITTNAKLAEAIEEIRQNYSTYSPV